MHLSTAYRDLLDRLAARLTQRLVSARTLRVAIDGRCAASKAFTAPLIPRFRDSALFGVDSSRAKINHNFDCFHIHGEEPCGAD